MLSAQATSPMNVPGNVMGLRFDPVDPYQVELIFDDVAAGLDEAAQDQLVESIAHYFFTALAIPDRDLWVNLSPVEPDRVMPAVLKKTRLGRDMLQQDLFLKQQVQTLMDPKDAVGSRFWSSVFQSQQKKQLTEAEAGFSQKVWIVPDEVGIAADETQVWITDSRLKIQHDDDLQVILKSFGLDEKMAEKFVTVGFDMGDQKRMSGAFNRWLRPVLEERVNNADGFQNIRQMYHAVVLAVWYKTQTQHTLAQMISTEQDVRVTTVLDGSHQDTAYSSYQDIFHNAAPQINEAYDPLQQSVATHRYTTGGTGFQRVENVMKNQPTSSSSFEGGIQKLVSRLAIKDLSFSNEQRGITRQTGEAGVDQSSAPTPQGQSNLMLAVSIPNTAAVKLQNSVMLKDGLEKLLKVLDITANTVGSYYPYGFERISDASIAIHHLNPGGNQDAIYAIQPGLDDQARSRVSVAIKNQNEYQFPNMQKVNFNPNGIIELVNNENPISLDHGKSNLNNTPTVFIADTTWRESGENKVVYLKKRQNVLDLSDNFGNVFSIIHMGLHNSSALKSSEAAVNMTVEDLIKENDQLYQDIKNKILNFKETYPGKKIIWNAIHWVSPEALVFNVDKFRVPIEWVIGKTKLSEDESKKLHSVLLYKYKGNILYRNPNGSDYLITPFQEGNIDQLGLNPYHPDVKQYYIDSYKKMIDLGADAARIDLGHMQLYLNLKQSISENDIIGPYASHIQNELGEQKEPWLDIMLAVEQYAFEQGRVFQFIFESYQPEDIKAIFKIGDQLQAKVKEQFKRDPSLQIELPESLVMSYYKPLREALVGVIDKSDGGMANLANKILEASQNKKQNLIFSNNFDELSLLRVTLDGIRSDPDSDDNLINMDNNFRSEQLGRAINRLMLVLAHQGLFVMQDLVDFILHHGSLVGMVGGVNKLTKEIEHAFPLPQELAIYEDESFLTFERLIESMNQEVQEVQAKIGATADSFRLPIISGYYNGDEPQEQMILGNDQPDHVLTLAWNNYSSKQQSKGKEPYTFNIYNFYTMLGQKSTSIAIPLEYQDLFDGDEDFNKGRLSINFSDKKADLLITKTFDWTPQRIVSFARRIKDDESISNWLWGSAMLEFYKQNTLINNPDFQAAFLQALMYIIHDKGFRDLIDGVRWLIKQDTVAIEWSEEVVRRVIKNIYLDLSQSGRAIEWGTMVVDTIKVFEFDSQTIIDIYEGLWSMTNQFAEEPFRSGLSWSFHQVYIKNNINKLDPNSNTDDVHVWSLLMNDKISNNDIVGFYQDFSKDGQENFYRNLFWIKNANIKIENINQKVADLLEAIDKANMTPGGVSFRLDDLQIKNTASDVDLGQPISPFKAFQNPVLEIKIIRPGGVGVIR